MDTSERDRTHTPYAILAPAADEALVRLSISPDLHAVQGGDPDRVRWMLRGIAANPEGRVAVAVDAGEIVGFVGLVAPLAGDRFSGVDAALELTTAEVARRHRGRGIFRALMEAALRNDLEERIVFAIADPALRDRRESTRAFRDRLHTTLGALGFFPYPTNYPGVTLHRDAAFLVRIGRGVPQSQVTDFFECLRRRQERTERVAIFLKSADLRNLIRTDLERHEFDVVAVSAEPGYVSPVDVVVTGYPDPTAAPVTVRIIDDDVRHHRNGIIYLPAEQLDRLPQILRREVARTRNTRWPRSSKNAS